MTGHVTRQPTCNDFLVCVLDMHVIIGALSVIALRHIAIVPKAPQMTATELVLRTMAVNSLNIDFLL